MSWKYIYEDDEEQLQPAVTLDTGAKLDKPAGFDDSAYQAKKPAYTSGYADRIDDLLTSLENRAEFRYDAESDPLYRQYRSQYRREGERAVDDTLAAAASHAGGMNSYAVTAAQQAGDYYNAKLMDVLPELTQLAYEMYQADYDEDVSRLKLLQSQEAEAYGRYQDALTDWYAELEAAYQQYRDSVADSKWREQMDYQKEQDAIDNAYRQDVFDYEKEQDEWYPQTTVPEYTAPKTEQKEPESAQTKVPEQSSSDRYAGTDYYQDAIDAALRGDRAAAEAALEKRAEKMSSPDYHGTGGGTSMAEAQRYINGLLEVSEDADIPEAAATEMKSKSEWKESRAAGIGPEAEYATYEDYVSDYLQYLMEEGV